MSSKILLLTPLVWLLLTILAGGAAAQLPDCNCYFNSDCPAATPSCVYNVNGGGPAGPASPERSCEWKTPKPPGGPGTGCDQPYPFPGGTPCDGVCLLVPPVIEEREWIHRDGRPGLPYQGDGCLPGGPYSYFVKLIVENEACDLPAHCSLCESETFIPAGTLAAGTAALVEATLTADCSAAGFTFDLTDTTIHAEVEEQVFDVCVNGANVTSSLPPPSQGVVCQDGTSPPTHQLAGQIPPILVPVLSAEGLALLATAILIASLSRGAGARKS